MFSDESWIRQGIADLQKAWGGVVGASLDPPAETVEAADDAYWSFVATAVAKASGISIFWMVSSINIVLIVQISHVAVISLCIWVGRNLRISQPVCLLLGLGLLYGG